VFDSPSRAVNTVVVEIEVGLGKRHERAPSGDCCHVGNRPGLACTARERDPRMSDRIHTAPSYRYIDFKNTTVDVIEGKLPS